MGKWYKYSICTVKRCDRPHCAKGFCTMHYGRFKKFGDPLKVTLSKERIFTKPYNKNSGFQKGNIPWHKGKTKKDFPQLSNSGTKKGTISKLKGKKNSITAERNRINNPMKNKAIKNKASQTRKKKCASGDITIWNKGTKGLMNAWNKGLTGKIDNRIKKSNEKHSLTLSKMIQNGTFKPTQYNNRKTGYFYSEKNKKELWYSSSYELLAFQLLEGIIFIKTYKTNFIRVPYIFEGSKHNYIVDLFIEYNNGEKQLIEVKANWQLNEERTKAKLKAGKEYAKERNMKFLIWTEDKLILNKEVHCGLDTK